MKKLKTMQANYSTYSRIIAAGLIISVDNMVLLGRKDGSSYYPDCWHLPGGGVEDGETLREELIREIQEETGIDLNQEEALIEMIDDQGRREHLKTDKDGKQIIKKMEFVVFLVKIGRSASEINTRPGDDLEELKWIGLDKLHQVKHTPPSTELFKRLGL